GLRRSPAWPPNRRPRARERLFSLTPDRLEREVFLFHRLVVLQFVEDEPRPAVAAEVVHLELRGRPDALHLLEVGVIQATDDLILDVVLDARESVVVLPQPPDRPRVLGRLALPGH